ncbi:MAG: hypothetical protein WA824_04860 [Candidatus Sulfotelmatobacter sp.]
MRVAKNVALFGSVGLGLSLVIFGLASVAPSVFGWLTVPFWVLPAIANLGAHDVDWRLFLLSGTLSYGVIAFLMYHWRMRHMQR